MMVMESVKIKFRLCPSVEKIRMTRLRRKSRFGPIYLRGAGPDWWNRALVTHWIL